MQAREFGKQAFASAAQRLFVLHGKPCEDFYLLKAQDGKTGRRR
jgi:hypothetical protein